MAKKNHELTEAEWAIIQVIWENEPCAAPTVQELLEDSRKWTYSTVKTLMDRMVTKKLLKTEKIRNLILYRSAITKKQAQNSEIMRTVTRAFNGALTPMMQFMLDNTSLSKGQLDKLEELIREKKVKGRTNKKKSL